MSDESKTTDTKPEANTEPEGKQSCIPLIDALWFCYSASPELNVMIQSDTGSDYTLSLQEMCNENLAAQVGS